MRLFRMRTALTATLAVAAMVTGAVLAAGPAAAGPGPVVLVNPCGGQGQVRPAHYDIGCMPSSELVTGLRWAAWRPVAFGSGVLKVNDCTPTCAQGTYRRYPVATVLWRARPWPHHAGQAYFSRLTWIFTGKRPGHVPAAQTFTLPA